MQRIFIALVWVIASCTTAPTDNQNLKKEVIAIHDEAMAKMDRMMQIKRQLKSVVDSLGNEKRKLAIHDLNQAHDQMMGWMRNFSKLFPAEDINGNTNSLERSEAQEKNILNDEKVKIQEVRKMINDAIANGTKRLNEAQ